MQATDVTAAAVLKQARARSGLSQRELARRAGVRQSVVAAYESAAREPSLATLAGLVEANGISLDLELGADLPLPRPYSGPIGHRVGRRRAAVLALAARHGVTDRRVFGSVARGEEGPESAASATSCASCFTCPWHLVPDDGLKPRVRASIEADLVPL